MDGLALFERIQSQWLGMPVIIMTAHGTIPDAIQATAPGCSASSWPIDKDELLVTIEHAQPDPSKAAAGVAGPSSRPATRRWSSC